LEIPRQGARVFVSRGRSGRALVAVLIYLIGFLALLIVVARVYLVPAVKASKSADPAARRLMSGQALLLMTVMLLLLLMGLLITFRIGRFFRPRTTPRAKPTEYVDAWSESARRLKMGDEDQGNG
jgi:cytochrome b561